MKPFRDKDRNKNFNRKKRNMRNVQVVEMEQTIGIGLLNMKGMSRKGMEDVERAVKVQGLDVLCLVETHVRKEDRKGPSIEGIYHASGAQGGNRQEGRWVGYSSEGQEGCRFHKAKTCYQV